MVNKYVQIAEVEVGKDGKQRAKRVLGMFPWGTDKELVVSVLQQYFQGLEGKEEGGGSLQELVRRDLERLSLEGEPIAVSRHGRVIGLYFEVKDGRQG